MNETQQITKVQYETTKLNRKQRWSRDINEVQHETTKLSRQQQIQQ